MDKFHRKGARIMAEAVKHKPVRYTLGEEIVNAITHGIGALCAAAGVSVLLVTAENPWQAVSYAVYGASMVMLFTMSCLYHSFTHPGVKYVMRVFDHTSIFFLIAGTYTPLTLVTLRQQTPWVGWALFGVVWAAAAVGIVLNAVSIERFKKVSMVCYVASGWCVVAAIVPLLSALPTTGLILLGAGGLCYTGGILFYALKIKYMHGIWHLFVLAGAALHYFCVLLYAR